MSQAIKEMPAQEVTAESMITNAVNQGASIETIERLMAMRKELKAEQAKEAFFSALAAFQADCPTVKKTKEVKDKNGRVRYRYEPIDGIIKQVSQYLKNHGFSYEIKTEPHQDGVIAITYIHHISGHTESSSFAIPIDPDAYMNDAQKRGSALAYAKRYSFCNALGIMTSDEDDDAQSLGAGESPQDIYRKAEATMRATLENIETVMAIKENLDAGDWPTAAKAWFELDDEVKAALWVAPTKGGPFTSQERDSIKSTEFRQSYYGE